MRMQPTFRLELPGAAERLAPRLRETLLQTGFDEHADAAGSCLDFRVPPQERRLWSPHLSVQLSDTGEGVQLFGRFAPRPEVWTLVMMLYFGAAFVAIGGGVYGCVQAMLGVTPWAFAAVPGGLIAIGALHLVSVIGQRLSAHQMHDLRTRLDRVIAAAQEDSSLSP